MNQDEILKTIESMLYEHAINQKEVLSFAEGCKFLNISQSYGYKLVNQHKLSYFQPNGKLIYFKRVDLIEWVTKIRMPSTNELSAEINTHLQKSISKNNKSI